MARPKPADAKTENYDTVIVYDCDRAVLGRYESNIPLTDDEVRKIGAAIRKAYEAPKLKTQLESIDSQLCRLQQRKAEIGKKLAQADARRDTPHKPLREPEAKKQQRVAHSELEK